MDPAERAKAAYPGYQAGLVLAGATDQAEIGLGPTDHFPDVNPMADPYPDDWARAVLEQVADAIIFADTDGIIRFFNSAATRLFGYSESQAQGASLDLIIPGHLRQSHWRGFRAAVTAGTQSLQGRPTLTRATHASGRKLYVEMTFALVSDAAGVRGAVAVARDVTERFDKERAERAQKPTEGEGA